jgi:dihydrofolate synthase / folylpolyglutamate synthase
MQIIPIKTRVLTPPKDDIFSALENAIAKIPEKSILAITSKIVSIGDGRCIRADSIEKEELVKQEAEWFLPRRYVPGEFVTHTIKEGFVVASAGIDASNADDHYILWPKDSYESARIIHTWIQKTYNVSDVGVLITDSHSLPFRRGLVGMALAHHGFLSLHDYRGTRDIFGRELAVTMTNIPDSLAVAAVFVMGEGAEATPLALITEIPNIVFQNESFEYNDSFSSFKVPMEEDIFAPFFNTVPWEKGGGRMW